jgi:hypothetical protein
MPSVWRKVEEHPWFGWNEFLLTIVEEPVSLTFQYDIDLLVLVMMWVDDSTRGQVREIQTLTLDYRGLKSPAISWHSSRFVG